ncbi:hypothetical protein GCM10010430_68760 [Kitasatospora cystarginea]|uniref:Uncharacterized protein n=1 Tax=Kitasatospora cystarginea TaxID=58350 RepID=A0ABP5RVW4_9ACTN
MGDGAPRVVNHYRIDTAAGRDHRDVNVMLLATRSGSCPATGCTWGVALLGGIGGFGVDRLGFALT